MFMKKNLKYILLISWT